MADEAELAAKYDEVPTRRTTTSPATRRVRSVTRLAKELVEARQASRNKRESEALALSDGRWSRTTNAR